MNANLLLTPHHHVITLIPQPPARRKAPPYLNQVKLLRFVSGGLLPGQLYSRDRDDLTRLGSR